jgi:hypothetical protein
VITGTFSFDSAAPTVLVNPAGDSASYDTGDITVDQFALATGYPFRSTRVTDDNNGGINPQDALTLNMFESVTGFADALSLNLSDPSKTAWASYNLPTQDLTRAQFSAITLTFSDFNSATRGTARTIFDVVKLTRIPADADGDGVIDAADYCPGTIIPEPAPTSGKLGNGRHALTLEDSLDFTGGKAANARYSTADTAGCSCTQIVGILVLGGGQLKNGCSNSVMEAWAQGLR